MNLGYQDTFLFRRNTYRVWITLCLLTTTYQAIEHRRSNNARVILKAGLKDLKTNSPVMPAGKLTVKSHLCKEADVKTSISLCRIRALASKIARFFFKLSSLFQIAKNIKYRRIPWS